LIVDYENGDAEIVADELKRISDFLGLPEVPSADVLRILFNPSQTDVAVEITKFKPIFVTIDALRGFDATAEDKNANAAGVIKKLQDWAITYHVAILFIHHLRKADPKNPPKPLREISAQEWFQRLAGAGALVNQTAVRIAVDKPRGLPKPGL
jgi:RecA-family ATPase